MRILWIGLLGAVASIGHGQAVRSVTDISHHFTFYFDGRFGKAYVEPAGGTDVRNWGTVSKIDLRGANLFIAQNGDTPCKWTPNDIEALKGFVNGGGGLLLIGDYTVFPGDKGPNLNDLAGAFGAKVLWDTAVNPLSLDASFGGGTFVNNPTNLVSLNDPKHWTVFVKDKNGAPAMAGTSYGSGHVVVASRGFFGEKDGQTMNQSWFPRVIRWLTAGKQVDGLPKMQTFDEEGRFTDRGLEVQYSDYLEPEAKSIVDYYFKCLPEVAAVTGVPPSPGMLLNLKLLATAAGGFSNGRTIGLGAFWGGFPARQYGMAELTGHETTHSWVLPFAEPMWNEGLATYVGIQIGKRLGFKAEAEQSLAGWLRGYHEKDPTGKADISQKVDHAVEMGKPMFIFEELRKKFGEGVITRYFQTKRQLIQANRPGGYRADDSVAVLSHAVGMDLFPMFKNLGIGVDWQNTNISSDGLKKWDAQSAPPPR